MMWKENTKNLKFVLKFSTKCTWLHCITACTLTEKKTGAIINKKCWTIQTKSSTQGQRFWVYNLVITVEIIFSQRKAVKHCSRDIFCSDAFNQADSSLLHLSCQLPQVHHELYLVQSHMWWETAAARAPLLLRKTASHEPTSTASPQTEPCHGNTDNLKHNLSLSLCFWVHLTLKQVTIWGPGWASLQGWPPTWAWPPCPSAGGTRPGRSRRRLCADPPPWTPG